nr:cupin domain-containing protein [Escherichia coli]
HRFFTGIENIRAIFFQFFEIASGAEHWVVVAGTAKVTIDGDIKLLGENESIYIPLGATHCLENPGKIPLDLIEVRSGSYLEEDDVVRFADRYGRV